jgi:hypothetical protein
MATGERKRVVKTRKTTVIEYPEREVSIAAIHRDMNRVQSRDGLDMGHVHAIAEEMETGRKFDPPIVWEDDDGELWLGVGFHRTAAREHLGFTSILVQIRPREENELGLGVVEQAMLAGIEDNQRALGAKPLTVDDRKHAVEVMVRNEKTGIWSDNEIARRCGLAKQYVQEARLRLQRDEGIPIPEKVMKFSNGVWAGNWHIYRNARTTGKVYVRKARKNSPTATSYQTTINGNFLHLRASSTEEAQNKAQAIVENQKRNTVGLTQNLDVFLRSREIYAETVPMTVSILGGVTVEDAIVFGVDADDELQVFKIMTFAVATHLFLPSVNRVIILGYTGSLGQKQATCRDIIAGHFPAIRFMTPEEFLAEFAPGKVANEEDTP